MSQKPLHVQVAEALGWYECSEGGKVGIWAGHLDQFGKDATGSDYRYWDFRTIPRYDTDWSATGPLIERFQINLFHVGRLGWRAYMASDRADEARMDTEPLRAVCNLILALKASGKLVATEPALTA